MFRNICSRVFAALSLTVAGAAHAGIPTLMDSSQADGSDSFIDLMQTFAGQALTVVGLVLAGGALVWVGSGLVSKLSEVRAGKAEAAELVGHFVGGAFILVIVGVLASFAGSIF